MLDLLKKTIIYFWCVMFIESATTTTKTTSTTTITPKPGWIPVCNMQYGYSYNSNGVLVCNKDSFGSIRNASEV